MSKFYNKVAPQMTEKILKKVPMTESERLLTSTCTKCPTTKPTGVQIKHASYLRYVKQVRDQIIRQGPY
jgi:hypothetical protein